MAPIPTIRGKKKGPVAERNCGEFVYCEASEKRATRGKTVVPTSAASAPTSVNTDVHLTRGMHISYRYSLMPVVPKGKYSSSRPHPTTTYQFQHPPRGPSSSSTPFDIPSGPSASQIVFVYHFLPVFCLEQKKQQQQRAISGTRSGSISGSV